VADHDGKEIKALGDGFMVAFASVRKALECSVAIQEQLEDRNFESPGDEVRVRIGISIGEVTVEVAPGLARGMSRSRAGSFSGRESGATGNDP
jgi:class 3 adenylate cyclase